jgi:hypothetical protein
MYYNNLVEDEKQARSERIGLNFGYLLIIVGSIYLYLKWKKSHT